MAGKTWRGAVVGASTLLGKELAEELNGATDAVWDITLLDAEDAGGTMTAAGDEALVIQPIAADSFVGIDVVFFAGEGSTALAVLEGRTCGRSQPSSTSQVRSRASLTFKCVHRSSLEARRPTSQPSRRCRRIQLRSCSRSLVEPCAQQASSAWPLPSCSQHPSWATPE